MISIVGHFPRLETLVLHDMLVGESTGAMTTGGIRTLRSREGLLDSCVMSLPVLRYLEIIDNDTGSNRKRLVIATPNVDLTFPFLASSPVLTEICFDNLAIHDPADC